MPLTDTDICNDALGRLGAAPITSLDQASDRASQLKRAYPIARDATIRAYPWNCATRRASLAALAEAPAFGFANRFALPENPYCLRVLSINGETEFGLIYKIEGREILTDEAAPLQIVYLARVAEAIFDANLASTIAARLAAVLAYNVTGSAAAQEAARKGYQDDLVEARQVDAQEGSADSLAAADWLESRF